MSAEPAGGEAVVTSRGLGVSLEVAALLGTGFVRRLVEREFRASGGAMPAQLVAFFNECESVRRALTVSPSCAGGFPPRDGVSVSEFAEITGTSVQAVRKRCRRGTLRAWVDDTGAWRIAREEVPS